MDSVWMNKPWNMHVHLRQDEQLPLLARHTAAHFAGCLVMPNTVPPVWDAATLEAYRSQVAQALGPGCMPLMTAKLLKQTTPETIRELAAAGVTGLKLYPEGVTSNAQDGIPLAWLDAAAGWPEEWIAVLREIEKTNLVLNIHPELPKSRPLVREKAFIATLDKLVQVARPRIVIEHLSTRQMVDWVRKWSNKLAGRVAATLTPMHLTSTIDELLCDPFNGGMLNVNNHFWPCAKHPPDLKALRQFATSGEACVFAGTDSAPWSPEKKCSGCAGAFNEPVAVATYAEVFDEMNALEKLGPFLSLAGPRFYGVPISKAGLSVQREYWEVPRRIDGFTPWRAGQTIRFKVAA